MPDAYPRRFGPYVLLEPLGFGGMGRVTLAMVGDPGRERLCVIKRIRQHLREKADFVRRFYDEAELARRLSHGNLVETYGVGTAEGEPYIAQAFVDGCDLPALVDRSLADAPTLPLPVSIYIARELARGLAYAHDFDNLNLVHRDVSPQNVRLSFSGEVKLMDFGLALSKLKTTSTMAGGRWGRAAYMAPEQFLDGPVDRRADIYALGALLWELLTGQLFGTVLKDGVPTYEDDRKEVLARAFVAKPLPPSAFSPELPRELDAVVLKALERKPENRYATAGEMRKALGPFIPQDAVPEEALAALVKRFFTSELARAGRAEKIEQGRALLVAAAEQVPTDAPASGDPPPASEERHEEPSDVSDSQITTAPLRPRARQALWVSVALVAVVGAIVLVWMVRRTQDRARVVAAAVHASPDSPVAVSRSHPAPERSKAAVPTPPPRDQAVARPQVETPLPAPRPRPAPERPAAPRPPVLGGEEAVSAAQQLERASRAFLAGEFDLARREAERAVAMEPTAAGYVILGTARYRTGRLREAEQAFGEALRLDPTNETAQRRIELVRKALGPGGAGK